MPKIYEYLGIAIMFYSNEHTPIHIHAVYNENVIKVSFLIENEKITNIIYEEIHGKFANSKINELKKFIDIYKEKLVQAWIDFFILNKNISFERITKKL
jgi:hypothetical protein